MGKETRRLRNIYSTPTQSQMLPKEIKIVFDEREYNYHRIDLENKELTLRYGLNPHQSSAIYIPEEGSGLSKMKLLKSGKGGLSANNINDGYHALRIVGYFQDKFAVAIIKHLNPTGVAIGWKDSVKIFEDAWNVDERASYGCVIGLNFTVNEELAEAMINQNKFIECIFAPKYLEKALETLSKRRSLRIIEAPIPKPQKPEMEYHTPFNIKVFGDIIILETHFHTKIKSIEELRKIYDKPNLGIVTDRKPTREEEEWLLHAWWICAEKSSNGVVLWRENKTIAVTCGQQDRIGAIEIAIEKAKRNKHELRGSIMASDGFLLPDNIPPLIREGITGIIQPGGSIHDEEIIRECNKHNITMIFTGERIFRHF